MFISGSSSLEIKTNVLPFLVGRLLLFDLHTFDFEEFLLTRDKGLTKILKEKHKSVKGFLEGEDELSQPSFQEEFLKYWKEYAIFGGYPEVVKSTDKKEKIMLLKNIYSLYLEKDVIAFFRVEETKKFEDFTRMLAFNTASLLNLNSIASDLKLSYRRVKEFLEILQHSYVIHLVSPFHKNLVTELKKSKKVYFLDLGLRNCVMNNFTDFDFREDRGKLTENFVFRELLTNFEEYSINYWRTTGKAEVDFILTKEGEIVPVEVKLKGEKLSRGFYSFLKSYKPEKALVVTLDKFQKQKVDETLIFWIPVFYL
jgi:predicted AAA+ superfamily ATPase